MANQNGGVIAYPVMQAYGSLALDDSSDLCLSDIGQMSHFLRLHQCLLAPTHRNKPTACYESFWKRIWGFTC